MNSTIEGPEQTEDPGPRVVRPPSVRLAPPHPAGRLRALQARPKRGLSQSFLASPSVAEAMVRAAGLSRSGTALEIGPGLGMLTRPLVEAAGAVVCVEFDPILARDLPGALGFPANLTVIHGDVLALDLGEVVAEPYVVVSSLPYHIATPTLFKLLLGHPTPSRIVAMLQEEVALRVVATSGPLTYLGAAVATLATARMVKRVAPGSFFPVPKVRSAIVHLELRHEPAVNVDSVTRFFEFLRAGFTQPRKQLHNSLGQGLGERASEAQQLAANVSIDSRKRPGDLALEEWGKLYAAWRERGVGLSA